MYSGFFECRKCARLEAGVPDELFMGDRVATVHASSGFQPVGWKVYYVERTNFTCAGRCSSVQVEGLLRSKLKGNFSSHWIISSAQPAARSFGTAFLTIAKSS